MNSLVLSVFATLVVLTDVTSGQNTVCPAPFGHFPSNLNDACATFYWCWDGRAQLRTCPSGLSFDINTLTCVNQQQVACVNNNQVAAPLAVGSQGGATGQIQQPAINQVQVAGIQTGPVPGNPTNAVQPLNNQPVNPFPAGVPAQFPVNAGLAFPSGAVGAGVGAGAVAGARAAAGANPGPGANAVASAGAGGRGASAATNAAVAARARAGAGVGAAAGLQPAAVGAGGGAGAGVEPAAAIVGADRNGNQPYEGTAFILPPNINAAGQPFAANNWGQGVPGGQAVLGDGGQVRGQLPGNQGQAAGGESVPVVLTNQHQSASINQAQTVGGGTGG